MGITVNYTDPETGYNYPEAYEVVEQTIIEHATENVTLRVSVYGNESLYNSKKGPVKTYNRTQYAFGVNFTPFKSVESSSEKILQSWK